MNKQRKVLITITYNEMGIIIDTKAEEVAQPNLQQTCNKLATDCISRQAAIDALMAILDKPSHAEFLYTDEICGALNGLPSAQPELVKESGDLVKCLVKDDTISRQAAINAIRASTSKYTGFMEMEMYTDDDAVEAIEGLPSIQLSRIERELHGKTPEEQYKILYQLMFGYANTFNDARRAVIDWLGE